jgi:hypothetical protein
MRVTSTSIVWVEYWMSASQWVYGYVLTLLDRYFDGVELPALHVQLACRSGLLSELRLLLCQLRSFISYSNEDMDMFSSSLQSQMLPRTFFCATDSLCALLCVNVSSYSLGSWQCLGLDLVLCRQQQLLCGPVD